jgi:hypothetical protein
VSFDWQTPLALAVVALAAAHLLRGAVASWRGQQGSCGSCSSGKGSCGGKSGEPPVVTLSGLSRPEQRG